MQTVTKTDGRADHPLKIQCYSFAQVCSALFLLFYLDPVDPPQFALGLTYVTYPEENVPDGPCYSH